MLLQLPEMPQPNLQTISYTLVPGCLQGIHSRTPANTKIHGFSSALYYGALFAYKYAHPAIYFNSFIT